MPFDATIKAGTEKAANKLRDTLTTGNLDGLQSEIKKAIAGAKGADGAALTAARGFAVGSIDGKPVSRSLDFASLANTSGGGGKKGLSHGAIAGIAIGSVLGALLLAGLLWALCCRGARASSSGTAAATTAAAAHDAKLGATTAATTTGAAAETRTATTTTATDAKLGGVGAASGGNRAVAGGTAAAAAPATATTTTAVETEKQPSGLAKLASTLSGRRSKGAEAVDKAADKAVDVVKDAAQRV